MNIAKNCISIHTNKPKFICSENTISIYFRDKNYKLKKLDGFPKKTKVSI